MMRIFDKEIIRGVEHCKGCGLISKNCICDYSIDLPSNLRFILLTHENEFSRRTNTGRLIETAIKDTLVVKWSRVEPSKELLEIIENEVAYLLYPESDVENSKEQFIYNIADTSKGKINIILIDGTWQESVKVYNRSPYLHNITKISLDNISSSEYRLRRKKESYQLCTAEAAIEVLKIFDEDVNAKLLSDYFKEFQKNYR